MSDSDRDTVPLSRSYTEMTEMLQPNDANALGRALGGVVLHWMDICGAISALRFSHEQVVTASIDHVDFMQPIEIGEVAVVESYVFNVGKSSLDVKVDVHAENPLEGSRRETTTSFLTFVAIGNDGKPVEVPDIVCETDNETALRDEAKRLRQEKLEELIDRLEE